MRLPSDAGADQVDPRAVDVGVPAAKRAIWRASDQSTIVIQRYLDHMLGPRNHEGSRTLGAGDRHAQRRAGGAGWSVNSQGRPTVTTIEQAAIVTDRAEVRAGRR